MAQADVDTTSTTEIGLQLPDGSIVWPPDEWHDRSLDTPEGRRDILDALRVAEKNLGFKPDHFLSFYSWVEREKTMHVVTTQSDPGPTYEITYSGWDSDGDDDSGG